MCFRPTSSAKGPRKCPKCLAMNEPDAAVCEKCGTKLQTAPPAPGAITAPGAPKAPPVSPRAATPPKAPGQG